MNKEQIQILIDQVRQGKQPDGVVEQDLWSAFHDLIDWLVPWFLFGIACVALGYTWHYLAVR